MEDEVNDIDWDESDDELELTIELELTDDELDETKTDEDTFDDELETEDVITAFVEAEETTLRVLLESLETECWPLPKNNVDGLNSSGAIIWVALTPIVHRTTADKTLEKIRLVVKKRTKSV